MIVRIISSILFYLLTSLILAQNNDFKPFYIIGDNVNMRPDTNSINEVYFKTNFGEVIACRRISNKWYEYDTEYDQGYISARYLANENMFFKLAEKRTKKNGTTLYELEKIYLKMGMLEKAIDASIQIINTYKGATFPTHLEYCPKYNALAFYTILKNNKETIDYKNPMVVNYCNKVIKLSKDLTVTAWAMSELSRVYLDQGKYDLANNQIIKCLTNYDKYLLLPNPCLEYGDDKTGFVKTLKTDALNLKGKGDFRKFKKELLAICNSKKSSVAAKAVACEVLVRFEQ